MISVVTVNYKTRDYLERMLATLFAFHSSMDVEVIVVENASGDSLEDLERQYPNVLFLPQARNLGFAGGCNAGIRASHGEFVCLINPDILFVSPALTEIEQAMKTHPRTGIGGVSLKNLDGTQQACVHSFPKPLDQLLLLLKLHHVFPHLAPLRRWLRTNMDYEKSQTVDQVMGAFFCIRKELIDQIGLLDEGYFMWYEEVDYCRIAKKAGWEVQYFSEIVARHKKGSSFEKVLTWRKQSMLRQSIRHYLFKHEGRGIWLVFLLFEPLFWSIALAAGIVKRR